MAEVRSGSFNTTGYSDPDPLYADYCIFSWSLKSQDIEKATSTIEWTLKGAGGTGNYYTIARERYVTVNGSTQSATNLFNVATGTTVFSGTTVVQHNTTTGAGSFSASAGIALYYYPSYNSTGSGTWSLPTIARATKITFPQNATMGSAVSISLTPAVSTYKHKLKYEFGSLKNQTNGLTYGSNVALGNNFTPAGTQTITFVPPTSLGWEIPDTTYASCKVICETYTSTGTLIGTTTATVNLYVPAYTPDISLITLTGVNTLDGVYVMGKSSVTIATSANSYYGGSIKTYSAYIDGKAYSGAKFTTGVLTSGANRKFKITVYDSRGKSAEKESPEITVYAYGIPVISTFTIARDTSDPTKAIATLKASVNALGNKNAKSFKVKLNGVTNTLTSTSDSINTTTTFTNVPTDSTLVATATVTDSYTTVSREAVLPTVAVTMDFKADGTGIAMGKVAETSDLLDVAWRIKNSSVPTLIGGLGTNIPSNSNLNSTNYITPGNYVAASNATAQTLTNSPTGYAFKMSVTNCTNSYADPNASQWIYLVREITNYQGERWIQNVNKDTGSWVFSPWRLMVTSGNIGGYITTPADYIIEQGTYSDGWEYTKWNGGRIELWADKSITFPEPTNMGNYLWRSIYSLDMSSKLKSIISGTCCVQYSGMLPTFSRHSTILTMGEIVVATSKSFTGFTTIVPIYIMGKWK